MFKKFTYFIMIICIFFQTVLPAISDENAKYLKFATLKDTKTKAEIARTIIPDKFNIQSDCKWSKNLKSPFVLNILVKSSDNEVKFFYSSQQFFAEDKQKVLNKNDENDSFLRVSPKSFSSPEEYIENYINKNYSNITELKVVQKQDCPQEIKEILIENLYQKIEEYRNQSKSDMRITNTKIFAPYSEPYFVTYSYKINNIPYKQTFITMISSIDYEYTKKTNYNKFENFSKKLWTIGDFYSYEVKENDYDKYYDDFMIFVANTIFNNKATEAIELEKKQMIMELNPSFTDIHTGSMLKNMSSELFQRYYEGGKPSYTENKNISLTTPSTNNIKWFANTISPFDKYTFNKVVNTRKQAVYIPKQYNYLYYNTLEQKFIFSKNSQKLGNFWIQLKKSK